MKFHYKKSKEKVIRRQADSLRGLICGQRRLFSVKHATRAPSPCHPSEAKSKVTVLLNPPFPHTRTIKSPFPLNIHTHTQSLPLNTQTHARTKNTHIHTLSRAVMASHSVCPGHITEKSL